MRGWETRVRLKYYLEQGVSKAELSRRFGIARRTIHYWIETDQLDRDLAAGTTRRAPGPQRKHKLDPFKGIIDDGDAHSARSSPPCYAITLPGQAANETFDESHVTWMRLSWPLLGSPPVPCPLK